MPHLKHPPPASTQHPPAPGVHAHAGGGGAAKNCGGGGAAKNCGGGGAAKNCGGGGGGATGVTELLTPLDKEFAAPSKITLKLYETPFVKPVTVIGDPDPVAKIPPRILVTVPFVICKSDSMIIDVEVGIAFMTTVPDPKDPVPLVAEMT